MLVDIHLLQNHAPSNLNRDDTGAPKDAIFGAVPRARISSQCLKRSIRRSAIFTEAFGKDGLLGQRTHLFPEGVYKRLLERGDISEVEAGVIAEQAAKLGRESTKQPQGTGEKPEPEEDGAESESRFMTKQLIFFTGAELGRAADRLAELYKAKGEKAFKALSADQVAAELGPSVPRSVDIAMFGRMTTSAAFEDVHASVQVAHAISTHRVQSEQDYYTAVDDVSGEAGAGFIGDTEFNSATYYKYLSVHWDQLVENLGGDVQTAHRAVQALIEAAATVQPTGKQNSFAAHNLPDLVMIEVRDRNIPISYANAFLQPVRPSDGQSLMDRSVGALSDYVGSTANTFGLGGSRAHIATHDYDLPGSARKQTLKDLVEWLPTS